MKILMLSWEFPPIEIGGLAKHVFSLSKELVKSGNEVIVIARQENNNNPYPTYSKNIDGVDVIYVQEYPNMFKFENDLTSWVLSMQMSMINFGKEFLEKNFTSFKPDVIHAHDWLVGYAAIFYRDFFNKPLITTIHATEAGRYNGWLPNQLNKQIHSNENILVNFSDEIIVCSNSMKLEVVKLFHISKNRITKIFNGIETNDDWNFDNEHYKNRLLFVGRLEYEKGLHDLIEIFPHLIKDFPKIKLNILGDGTQKQNLINKSKKLGVQNYINFLGSVNTEIVKNYLSNSTAIIIPSIYEPFGIVALEAAAKGIPIISSNIGGLKEILTHKVDALLFPAKDQSELLKMILSTLNNSNESLQRTLNARKKIEKQFSWVNSSKQTLKIYKKAKKAKINPKLKELEFHFPLL